ncbi:AraC family transcriptional regulator [Chitinophaga qingshengii]|uniref:AraC family transcriptional regulator n=1 Tax=Chitinophaga qingshengii TaxID=1569794 RepID=A0ABR7TVH2_9BACT|nr:helix-turn-helix domain-containing protein [Chitinophaga qingshengii]MBC9934050.1 AraC family transcriptional regulator [Chitinophaga qingshengii]
MATFQERKPFAQPLLPYVDTYIQVSGKEAPSKYIPPHAGISLVMDFGHHSRYEGARLKIAVIGHQERPFYLHRTEGADHDALNIRFTAYGASAFVKLPLHEINNLLIDAADLFGPDIYQLYETLQPVSRLDTRIQLVETFLLNRLQAPSPTRQLIYRMADTLRYTTDFPALETIKTATTLSNRQIERCFRQLVGINMRQYRRMVRWEKARNLLEQNRYQKLSDIAYEAGYFDQSHFIADCRAMLNITPKEYKSCTMSH